MVDMMRQDSDMGYGETDLCRFVTLRYKGKSNMSMVAVLPQVPFQLDSVEQELCKPGEYYQDPRLLAIISEQILNNF